MAIYNQIFEEFRKEQREVNKAIELLESRGFIVYNKEKKYAADRKIYSNK